MDITYEYRAYPTSGVERIANKSLNICCDIYNYCVTLKSSHYKTFGTSLSKNDIQKALQVQKEVVPQYTFLYSQVLQEVTDRVETAFKAFFEGRNGYPRFHKYQDYKSLTYKQSGFRMEDHPKNPRYKIVYLSKIGKMKIRYHRELPSEYKRCNLVKKYGKWFIQFIVDVPTENPKITKEKELGCDLGLKNNLILSNGETIDYFKDNPRIEKLKEKENDLRTKLNENLKEIKKCKKKSKKKTNLLRIRQSLKDKLNNIMYKLYNVKKDIIFKKTRELLTKCSTLYLEDLQVNSLKSKEKNKKKKIRSMLQESSLSKIKSTIIYLFNKHNQKVVLVDSHYTSQACSKCGRLVHKELSERTHLCPYCGYKKDRDVNAARVILKIGQGKMEITKEAIRKYKEEIKLASNY